MTAAQPHVPSPAQMSLSLIVKRLEARVAELERHSHAHTMYGSGCARPVEAKPGIPVSEVPAGPINNVNTTFTLKYFPIAGSDFVWLNAVRVDDYRISGKMVFLREAPMAGDHLLCEYLAGYNR